MKIENWRENCRDIFNRISKREKLIYGTSAVVFLVHLFISLRYTAYLDDHTTFIVVEPFSIFIQHGLIEGLSQSGFQTNSYTGNPFFLLPFILLLGFTPTTVELVLVSSLAATTAIFFLIYNELFDYKRAVLGVLILLNFDFWIARWHATDYMYSAFLAAILVFLYLKWMDLGFRSGKYYLYTFSFLGGLFFYFKSTILYLLAGLGLATLYQKRAEVLRKVNIPLVLILFLAGAAPFIGYSFVGDHSPFSELLGVSNPLEGSVETPELFNRHEEKQGVAGTFVSRVLQLNDILTPEHPQAINNLNIPYDYLGGLERYRFDDVDYVSGIHLTSILFALALSFTLIKGSNSGFAVVFVSFFLFLLIVPSNTGLEVGHLFILLPFTSIILLEPLRSQKYDRIVAILCLILTFTFVSALSEYAVSGSQDLPAWGGTPEFYDDFEQLIVDEEIVTNSFKVNTISYFFKDIDHVFVRPENMSVEDLHPSSGGVPRVVYNEELSLDGFRPEDPVILVLRKEMICTPGKEFCGSDTDRILEKFNLNRSQTREVTLGEDQYLVRRGVKLDN